MARNGDSERMSVVYLSRTGGVLRGPRHDGPRVSVRHALAPTTLRPRLAVEVAERPDKCRQGNTCISYAWCVCVKKTPQGVENRASLKHPRGAESPVVTTACSPRGV